MTINKFSGKTKEEAIEKAKKEFGESAVIMNVKEVKPKGLFSAFKHATFEVTAAMEEKEAYSAAPKPETVRPLDNINLSADEKIAIPVTKKPILDEDTIMRAENDMTFKQSQQVKKSDEIEKRLESLSNILEKKTIRRR